MFKKKQRCEHCNSKKNVQKCNVSLAGAPVANGELICETCRNNRRIQGFAVSEVL